jgi:hypothetical protein
MEEIFASDPEFDEKNIERLTYIVEHGYTPNRARAISALARRSASDPALRSKVVEFVASPKLREARTMGFVSLAHIGVLGMIAGNGGVIPPVVVSLYSSWPEPDRGDLLWFLQSQHVDVSALTSPRAGST